MNKLFASLKKLSDYKPEPMDKLSKVETYFLLFFSGSIIGWIYELFFYLIVEDRLTNSGFFFGPYLPIYGFGALLILLFAKRFKKYPVLVFLIPIPVTGIFEYAVGYIMYEIWETRWWDYTNVFMNIDGFVCLRSVLTFAIGAVFLVYIIEPLMWIVSEKMGKKLRGIICISILALLLADAVLTVLFRMPDFA